MLHGIRQYDFQDDCFVMHSILIDFDFEPEIFEEQEIDLEEKDSVSVLNLLAEYLDGFHAK